METENKYKTFGELKVGDEIIAVDVTTNDKSVHEVSKIEKERDCNNTEFVRCWLGKPSPYRLDRICVPALAYVTQCTWIIYTSDADNADKIIEEIRIKKKREQEEESKRKRLEAIREQAQKNPPRFIVLHQRNNKEITLNIESIKMIKAIPYSVNNPSEGAYVYAPEPIGIFETTETYEEIKAKLGL